MIVQDCPVCPNQGWYVEGSELTGPEQVKCEFCHEEENSIFKIAHRERSVIIMRGASGSGKSTLAKKIFDSRKGKNAVIVSADDIFTTVDGTYLWSPNGLAWAHSMCRLQCGNALEIGINTVIIDNTNLDNKSRYPYVKMAKQAKYESIVVDTNTPWAKDVDECVKKNIHKVPYKTIEKQIRNLEYAEAQQS